MMTSNVRCFLFCYLSEKGAKRIVVICTLLLYIPMTVVSSREQCTSDLALSISINSNIHYLYSIGVIFNMPQDYNCRIYLH